MLLTYYIIHSIFRFKRLTGRCEVAVTTRDYKYYSPRHKHRRSLSQPLLNIHESAVWYTSQLYTNIKFLKGIFTCSFYSLFVYMITSIQAFSGSDSSPLVGSSSEYQPNNEVRPMLHFMLQISFSCEHHMNLLFVHLPLEKHANCYLF